MKEILEKLVKGEISIEIAEEELKTQHVQEIGHNIKIDKDREERVGVPEAVYSQSKSDDDLLNIINNVKIEKQLMITRLPEKRYKKIQSDIHIDDTFNVVYHKQASILTINKEKPTIKEGKVGIITAGTSDIPVAEEARITIQQAGYKTITTYDVGVAGIHRLFDQIALLLEEKVDVMIVAAGMEGALPSVVAGLVDTPIIAVPTATGYGVGEKGFTALFSMLQSCAPGIAVVNIDNGYGAGVYAITILKQIEKEIKFHQSK
jgi:NCAIR mutase (PurE)-related protein